MSDNKRFVIEFFDRVATIIVKNQLSFMNGIELFSCLCVSVIIVLSSRIYSLRDILNKTKNNGLI